MIVAKAVNMAQKMSIPIVGIVENMAYFECDQCAKRHPIFGESNGEQVAATFGLPLIAQIPIDPSLATLCDAGKIETYQSAWLDQLAERLAELL